MSLPLWGNLEKAQDDNTTIEEAIAEAIDNHNSDSEAHLGSGESLDDHKLESVIDHPIGSVVADKLSITEIIINTFFESLDPWNVVGYASVGDFSGVQLYVEWGDTETSRIYSQPQVPSNFFDSDKNMLFQTIGAWLGDSNTINSWFGFLDDFDNTAIGFGFQVRDGDVYCYVKSGSVTKLQLLGSVDISEAHIYRAQYDATDSEVTFFVDGSEVATLERSDTGSWSSDSGPQFGINITEENDGPFYFQQMYVSREI